MKDKTAVYESLQEEIIDLIINLRRKKNVEKNWPQFKNLIENNIKEICETFNTRWLVSIADTYADYGDDIEQRNAMLISLLVNMEKLFATRLLMYDITLNSEKLEKIKYEKVTPLWDGVTSFNILNGDMTNNLFSRLRKLLKSTPVLSKIFETILRKLAENNCTLSDINQYHGNIFKSSGVLQQFWKNLRKDISRLR